MREIYIGKAMEFTAKAEKGSQKASVAVDGVEREVSADTLRRIIEKAREAYKVATA